MNHWSELLAHGVERQLFGAAAARVRLDTGTPECHWVGKPVLDGEEEVGRHHLFDLASLTKPLATLLAVIRLVEEGVLDFDAPLSRYLSGWEIGERGQVRISHLLRHTSGLPAHVAYYEELAEIPEADRLREREAAIRKAPLLSVPGAVTCYSDIGFMLLRYVVERCVGRPFKEYVERTVFPDWEVEGIRFLGAGHSDAPTVETGWSPIRKRRMVGDVNDENAAFVGGADGQAGLFGTLEGVGALCERLMERMRNGGGSDAFRACAVIPESVGCRPMGWDRPSGTRPTCGPGFSSATIGHLGFTGTSVWMDLDRNLSVVLLTNRVVYPDTMERMRAFRTSFHSLATGPCTG